jgi:hypothetical protein
MRKENNLIQAHYFNQEFDKIMFECQFEEIRHVVYANSNIQVLNTLFLPDPYIVMEKKELKTGKYRFKYTVFPESLSDYCEFVDSIRRRFEFNCRTKQIERVKGDKELTAREVRLYSLYLPIKE